LVALLVLVASAAVAGPAPGSAWLIEVEGPIGPATSDHLVRGLAQAGEGGAAVVVVRIDTPGGLDTAMRDMIRAVLASDVPVLGWVGPGGARAASAGTYLLYATHLAAMAPGTNLGAATPVQVGAPDLPSVPSEPEPAGDGQPGDDTPAQGGTGGNEKNREDATAAPTGSAMEKKMINDAVAYIQSLAQLRGRNGDWAERAVREGASLAAADALAQGVIELVVDDVPELLRAADGREVSVDGGIVALQTEGLALYTHPVDWRSEFLAVITNPNVAYILMLVGVYGLLLEFYNPGVGLPGVLGGISLLLALYAFQALPVSYAGMALILLGIGLMTAEAFAPSFGILGLGGIAAFVFGSIMLMDTELPAYQIAMPIILGFAVFSVALLVFALGMLMRARRSALVSGIEHMLGGEAVVESVDGGVVRVRMDGELWQADCDQALGVADRVVVDAIDGLTLRVSRADNGSAERKE
jgi:membrane-bound serine protease (ClpP class)